MHIGIVGHGVVGKHLERLFRVGDRDLVIYDKLLKPRQQAQRKQAINQCDLVFVSVPTPSCPTGECDTSVVEEVVDWIMPPICIKSTIGPGTTDRLIARTGKSIVFSPEYVGETPFHRYSDDRAPDLVVAGGISRDRERVLRAYRAVLGPEPHYFGTDAITAELSKYMENCFFAAKVAFVAQFYLLASAFGADFTQMREIWVADSRVGRSHSTVLNQLGFDGKCLPKDLSAIIASASLRGAPVDLLKAIRTFNNAVNDRDTAP
jgi:UDPglucose 6-dehydrogenase